MLTRQDITQKKSVFRIWAAVLLWAFLGNVSMPAYAANSCSDVSSRCTVNMSKNRETSLSKATVDSMKSSGSSGCINPWPVDGGTMVSGTGQRNGSPHNGFDISVGYGTPVKAVADGWILDLTKNTCTGGGRTVYMLHEKGCSGATGTNQYYFSVYMHLSQIPDSTWNKTVSTAKAQQDKTGVKKIAKGTVIGFSGGSNSNGSIVVDTDRNNVKHTIGGVTSYGLHAHVEIRDGNTGNPFKGANVIYPACSSLQGLCNGNAQLKEPDPQTQPTFDQSKETQPANNYNASMTGCGKLYAADNIAAFHQRGESGGNTAAFNKCWAEDKGGCSYGLSQMACMKDSSKWNGSSVAKYLQLVQKEYPEIYKQLECGGSLQNTIKAACTPPATEFYNKWKSVSTNNNEDFAKSQGQIIDNIYMPMLSDGLKKNGYSELLNRSPELQMVLLGGAVAGPAYVPKALNKIFAAGGALQGKKISEVSDAEIIKAYYDVYAETFYSGYADKSPYQKRAATDSSRALESLKIRETYNELKKTNPTATLEDATQKASGKRACNPDEDPKAVVRATSTAGTYAGSTPFNPAQTDEKCNVQSYRNSYHGCLFCDVFKILFNTASAIAKKSFTVLAESVSILVVVGFALWLAFTIVKYISAMEQKEPRLLIKTILNQAFVVFVVYLILQMDSISFFGLAMEPIFNTGFDLAQMVVAGENGETCQNVYAILTEAEGAGLPESMGVSILCTIETIQGKLLDVMALGSTAMCVGFFKESLFGLPIFPHLGYVIIGVLLWLAAIMLMVIYPFLLIDSVLQLSVATALLPAAIGAYAFKITQKYVNKIWETFLSCMFTFIFLSIIIFILTEGLVSTTNDIFNGTGLLSAGSSGTSWGVILDALAWWGVNFLKLVFFLFLGKAVLGSAAEFAGNFASGISVKPIGSMVGGMAAGATTKLGLWGAKKVGGAAKSVGGAVWERGKENVNSAMSSWRTNRRANRINNSSNTQTDANGNKSLTHRTWYGRKVTDVLSTGADGSQKVTRTKHGLITGKAKNTVENDSFVKTKREYDKDGNVVREVQSMVSAAGKTLFNRDGSKNQIALQAIRNGSTHSQEDIDKAVMNQMLQERLGGVPGADMNSSFKSRESEVSQDDQGRRVFTVKQLNTDGSTSIFKMTEGDTRMMIEFEKISKSGKAVHYASDGIVNKRSTYAYDKDGQIKAKSVKNQYAFSAYYKKYNNKPMDSNGRFTRDIPADEIMMSDADMKQFRDQIATYGTDKLMNEFKV